MAETNDENRTMNVHNWKAAIKKIKLILEELISSLCNSKGLWMKPWRRYFN